MKLTVYNANNEEPKCNRCDHCNDEYICIKYCGPEHCWSGYERIVDEEE